MKHLGQLLFCVILMGTFGCQSIPFLHPDDMKVELTLGSNARLGEGAIWDQTHQRLLYVDIEGKSVKTYYPLPNGSEHISNRLLQRVGTVVPYRKSKDTVVVALEDGVYKVSLTNHRLRLIAPVEADKPGNRLNDGKCDPAGRLWVGSMHYDQKEGAAALYRVERDGSYSKVLDSVTISNGLAWSLNQRTMYYIDTPTRKIMGYDFDMLSGDLSNGRIVVEVNEKLGHPDGMTIDREGKLWVGMWGGSCVARFDPKTGQLMQTIPVPAPNVTSCAFGGENLDVLYITTARLGLSAEQLEAYPLSGSLFEVKPGVRGIPAEAYQAY